MSFVGSGTTGTELAQKFLDSLQNDFRNLGAETKKKNPQIKEVNVKKYLPLNIQQLLRCAAVGLSDFCMPQQRKNLADLNNLEHRFSAHSNYASAADSLF
jgi:hypothetical protein